MGLGEIREAQIFRMRANVRGAHLSRGGDEFGGLLGGGGVEVGRNLGGAQVADVQQHPPIGVADQERDARRHHERDGRGGDREAAPEAAAEILHFVPRRRGPAHRGGVRAQWATCERMVERCLTDAPCAGRVPLPQFCKISRLAGPVENRPQAAGIDAAPGAA
jgi:hypothetical protein